MQHDVIVIGSGIGGLVAAALLAHDGQRVLVCESHTQPGGAAHSFVRQGFQFDAGPSFYCGLSDSNSLNPLRQVFESLEESIETISYDPLGHYHFPEGTLPVWANQSRYLEAVSHFTTPGAEQFERFYGRLLELYDGLKGIPVIALRSDWRVFPILWQQYRSQLWKLLPKVRDLQRSTGYFMDQIVTDPWVRRLIDLECFLLSGLPASGTVAPEMAFMFGERSQASIEYPVGGSGALVEALVRGLRRFGGELRLGVPVTQIILKSGRVAGVQLQTGETLSAPVVISNATLWDTYTKLLQPEDLPAPYRQRALKTPAIDSFMHLHLGIKAPGLTGLTGHHVVVHQADLPITTPGNTCMISIPSVWDPNLAPPGCHVVHAYTLEPYTGWQRDQNYATRKRQKAEPLYQALERVIPDIRDRVVLELIGTPLTHAHFLHRYQGTYGPGIVAGQGQFPGMKTPIPGLYRVGDSTVPGIGVPAVAASGILCANTLGRRVWGVGCGV